MPNNGKSITEIFDDGAPIDQAIGDAVEEALRMHKKAGNPVATWQNGKVVWIPPDQKPVDE